MKRFMYKKKRTPINRKSHSSRSKLTKKLPSKLKKKSPSKLKKKLPLKLKKKSPLKLKKKSPLKTKTKPEIYLQKDRNDAKLIETFQEKQNLKQKEGLDKWEKEHSNVYTLPIESLRKLALEKLVQVYQKTRSLTQEDKDDYFAFNLKKLKRKFDSNLISLEEMNNEEMNLNKNWNKRVELVKKKQSVTSIESLKKLFYEDYVSTMNTKAEDLADYITNAPLF